MRVIAITGTKGKSSTTFMLTHVLKALGEPVAAIGSLGYSIKDRSWPNTLKMTMPGRTKLHAFMRQAADAGCRWCVLEATSEGIAQHRLTGITIDCAVLTNLRPEHIESHGSFEAYKQAKLRLFQQTQSIHVLNAEDPFLLDFASYNPRQTITYGHQKGMVTRADVPNLNLRLLGDFNESNALAVIAICIAYGFAIDDVVSALNAIEHIPGRMETVALGNGARAIVDYAHTPDSLEAVYRNIRSTVDPGGKIIAVLGAAGGGRDVWKRPIFGSLAQQYADTVILTNEDPFDEDPQKIIQDIKNGFKQHLPVQAQVMIDRKKAIEYALQLAQPHDWVVITGKGSEVSMALKGGIKIPWSDKKIVEEYMRTSTMSALT